VSKCGSVVQASKDNPAQDKVGRPVKQLIRLNPHTERARHERPMEIDFDVLAIGQESCVPKACGEARPRLSIASLEAAR
jgi:hypothetical protein